MQFPGMTTDPVRVTLEVTFDPSCGEWSLARREFRRDAHYGWRLESMATNGTPLTRGQLSVRLEQAVRELHEAVADPSGTIFGEPPFP